MYAKTFLRFFLEHNSNYFLVFLNIFPCLFLLFLTEFISVHADTANDTLKVVFVSKFTWNKTQTLVFIYIFPLDLQKLN